MDIKEITDRSIWDGFVGSFPDFTFLQGWSWGEFNIARGERVWRWGVYEGSTLIGVCQVVSVTARRGSFLFVPHGPLSKTIDNSSFLSHLIKKMVDVARASKYSFIRISPWLEATDENKMLFSQLGFSDAPSYMHAEETWLLPLEGDEQALLREMRKTTRNLISRAERDGVEIIKSSDVTDLRVLFDLQKETALRHNFVPFSENYLKTEFEIFRKSDEALLFLGKHNGVISSAAIIIFFGKRAFYFQSGSIRSVAPVSYILQWEVIKEAKRRGCLLYNLWGVAPENDLDHQWVGLTTFKSGFGGHRKNYMHAQDLPLSKKYWITYIAERIPRRFRLRLRPIKKG
jgi:Uncharacterized protein involved in methicillin resistance